MHYLLPFADIAIMKLLLYVLKDLFWSVNMLFIDMASSFFSQIFNIKNYVAFFMNLYIYFIYYKF